MKKVIIFLLVTAFANAQKTAKLTTPPYLKKGDTIVMLAPAGFLKDKSGRLDNAKKLIESWGLHITYGKHLFSESGHFAGTDEERAEDFQKALDNPNIKAVFCARGGYGSVRVLDKLDYTTFKENPKWVIGYSDITAFHNHIHNLGIETIHGMMGISVRDSISTIAETVNSFKKAVFGKTLKYKIDSSKYNRQGKAKGVLVGGNLSLLASMLGSKSNLNTSDKILFIEDVGEELYAIDRMLQSLKRAGYFTNCKGLIVGDFSDIPENTTDWGSSIEELILNVVKEYNFPVLFHFPAGHEKDNRALILGRNITLNVRKNNSKVIFD